MARAVPEEMKPAEGLVLCVKPFSTGLDPGVYPRLPAGWIDVLAAGVNGDEVELLIDREHARDVEKGITIVLLSAGMVRCRLKARRLSNGVFGHTVVLAGADIALAVPVSVPRDLLLVRWESAFGRPPLLGPTFTGARKAWWLAADEKPFPGWAGAGLPAELAEVAKGLVRSFPRHGAPVAGPSAAPTLAPAVEPAKPATPALVVHAPQAVATPPKPPTPPAKPPPAVPPGQGSLF